MSEDNRKLRPGCPRDYQIFCERIDPKIFIPTNLSTYLSLTNENISMRTIYNTTYIEYGNKMRTTRIMTRTTRFLILVVLQLPTFGSNFASLSDQLINELFPDCLKVKLFALVLRHRGGDRIYEMRCLFVAVGPNAHFVVLPHWDNMSQAHMLPDPVTLY